MAAMDAVEKDTNAGYEADDMTNAIRLSEATSAVVGAACERREWVCCLGNLVERDPAGKSMQVAQGPSLC